MNETQNDFDLWNVDTLFSINFLRNKNGIIPLVKCYSIIMYNTRIQHYIVSYQK